jgi:hypothetical protein
MSYASWRKSIVMLMVIQARAAGLSTPRTDIANSLSGVHVIPGITIMEVNEGAVTIAGMSDETIDAMTIGTEMEEGGVKSGIEMREGIRVMVRDVDIKIK